MQSALVVGGSGFLGSALANLLEVLGHFGVGPQPPLLTRYVVASTCYDFNFIHTKAARDFGYQPIVSEEQAMQQTIAWLRQAGFTASPGQPTH